MSRRLVFAILASSAVALALVPVALAAPGGPPSLADAQRAAGGYAWSVLAVNAEADGAVEAIAPSAQGPLVAHSPLNYVGLVDVAGQLANEAILTYGVTSLSAGPTIYGATGDLAVDGAGDVYERTAGGWVLAYDGAERTALVARNGSFVYALAGSPEKDGAVHVRDRRKGWISGVATLPGALPSAATAHRRALWVGARPSTVSGPARLFTGRRTRFSEVAIPDPGPAPAMTERQEVTALLSGDGFLVIGLGTFDAATGAPIRGQLLLLADGRKGGAVQAATLAAEVPSALAWADGSLVMGTSMGRLLHLESSAWVDEPGLPPNTGVLSLSSDSSGVLVAGVRTAGGAQLLTRTVKAAPPPKPLPVPVTPSGLVATAPLPTQVALKWSDNSVSEIMFLIDRSPAGADMFVEIAVLGMDATSYVDNTVQPDTAYDYRVLAAHGGGSSPPSNVATVKTPAVVAASTYVADVKPILAGQNPISISCAACHANRSYKLSVNLADETADYTATLKVIDLATPANSELLLRPTKQKGHPIQVFAVGSKEYDAILRWIQGGAVFK